MKDAKLTVATTRVTRRSEQVNTRSHVFRNIKMHTFNKNSHFRSLRTDLTGATKQKHSLSLINPPLTP